MIASYFALAVMVFGMAWFAVTLYKNRRRMETESSRALELIERQSEIYKDMAEHGYEAKAIKHDLQKQFSFRNMLTENPSLSDILRVIMGRYILNGLDLGIQIHQTVDEEATLPLDATETISLLVNLLDNAMEACVRAGRGTSISFVLAREENGTLLEVENSKREDDKPLETQMKTTKENETEHGIGTEIVLMLVKRYDGKIQYDDLGTSFRVKIHF